MSIPFLSPQTPFTSSTFQLTPAQPSALPDIGNLVYYFSALSYHLDSDHYIYDGLSNVEDFCMKLAKPSDLDHALDKLLTQVINDLFDNDMDKEKLSCEIEKRWNLLGALEDRYLVLLGHLIDQDPKILCNMTKDGEDYYKDRLRRFIIKFADFTYDFDFKCRTKEFTIKQFTQHKPFMSGFPSLFEKNENPLLPSPLITLMSLTKEQLAAKDPDAIDEGISSSLSKSIYPGSCLKRIL